MGIISKLNRWIGLWRNQFRIKKIKNKRCGRNNKILIIKLDAIGDFIIWLDSAKEYRGLFTNKKLILLCNAVCKEIAEATGYFDEIVVLNISKYESDNVYRCEKDAELEKQSYEMLIQTTYSRTQHMDMLAATISANKKIAFEADESKSNISRSLIFKKNKARLDSIYDQLIPASNDNLMEIQRNKEFIIGLGKKDFKSAIPKLPRIEGVNVPPKPYFVVFPGASTKIKMWRPERYSEIINYVQKLKPWDCIVCGSKDESYLFDIIVDKINNKDRIENYSGRTSLKELIEIVRNSEFVISNDTSGIHYAAATGVKGICPFGEYNYGRFLPYIADEGEETVSVCTANMKCRNCSVGHMTLLCIINIIKNGRYLCLDQVKSDDLEQNIFALLFHNSV